MDRNQVIGFLLIFVLFFVWSKFFAPSPEAMQAEQVRQDSLAQVAAQAEQAAQTAKLQKEEATPALPDSVLIAQRGSTFGALAAASVGTAATVNLSNDVVDVAVSSKGGAIASVTLKKHFVDHFDSLGNKTQTPLQLLQDSRNRFEYLLPVKGAANGIVRSSDLFFKPALEGNTLKLTATMGQGQYIQHIYTLRSNDGYLVDYQFKMVGLQDAIRSDAQTMDLYWENRLHKLEVNDTYERNYSTVYFKPVEDATDRCSCTSSDEESSEGQAVKWVSATNQFFNTSFIAQDRFKNVDVATEMAGEDEPILKTVKATLQIPLGNRQEETFAMQVYVGPNDFETLNAIDGSLTEIIPFGSSIFGTINRWIIRPLFNFFDQITGNKGIAILLLTLLVKLLLYPLTYKMIYSQSKMQAMKPYLEKLKGKHKDDPQAQQMETMKMYREYGVNPLGGCMPMLLQMPIWFALFRFFPASISFRQEPFLWAHDLSSYDILTWLPFEVPLGFGSHISLFAVLWAVSTLLYTYYNSQHMDFSAQPAMKYFQYIMPLMFLGFFNSYAAGLTSYMFFSNLLNIGQTVVTKNLIIDQDKIASELEANKAKPKTKTGFQERLEQALKEQQKKQAETQQGKKKK